MKVSTFQDRWEAGRVLAGCLGDYANAPDVWVLGLPRGGVPVAFAVARELNAPLDVFLVRKLGVPGEEELAMGALAAGGVRVLNRLVIDHLQVPDQLIDSVTARERAELERRSRAYRNNRPLPDVKGKTVILVDDGLATGATMRAAITALRAFEPARLVVAVPVGARETCDELRPLADELICVVAPAAFDGVGRWYEDFAPVSDSAVRELLDLASEQS